MKSLLLFMTLACLPAIAQEAESIPYREARQVMGTLGEVQIWSDSQAQAEKAADNAFAMFARVDSLMSTWNQHSALSRFNSQSDGRWYPVGPDISFVLNTAQHIHSLSAGAFDPSVLPLMRLWGFRGGAPALPDSLLLQQTLAQVDAGALQVDHNCARFARDDMALDLGGIAKGYALDLAVKAMKEAGATAGVLDLGGNVLVFGQASKREVAVLDPQSPEQWAFTLSLTNQAVATSGQYERFVAIDGQSYGHVIDPRTGWPIPNGLSATVVAPTGIWADGLATALLIMGRADGLQLIESLDQVEAVFIDAEGAHPSSGLASAPVIKDDKPK